MFIHQRIRDFDDKAGFMYWGNKASEVTGTLNATVNVVERTTREHTWIIVRCIFHAGEDRFGTGLLGVHVYCQYNSPIMQKNYFIIYRFKKNGFFFAM